MLFRSGSKECYGDYPFKIEQISSPVTVKTAIENPNVFYCNVDNWNTNAEVNLWSSSKSSSEIYKTIYDPSPIGYRMATYEILDLLNSGEWISKDDYNAYLFDYNDGTVAMYADGMRSGISAEIINDQTKGYYWCNTYYDIDKDTISSGDKNGYWYMEISKDGHSFSNIGTSNAYSVRPVQP